ncbi:hypothetical protein KKH23_05230 [Patescibacteria group bacterium]|nr:hypothetical protein [Patescibacteria group bacterium]MBU0846572.1 hypothetical protein [Patescibacteria group bacterium]
MSHRLVLTVSNDHFKWLEIVQKKKGLENIQEAIRSVLEDGYSSYIESNATPMQMQTQMQTLDVKRGAKQMIGVPVSATPQGGGIQ